MLTTRSIALVTGGGKKYQPYIRALVNSIHVHNSAGYPLYVLDMGLTDDFRAWLGLHPTSPKVLDIGKVDPYEYFAPGFNFPEIKIPHIKEMRNSFRKLVAVEMIIEDYFYWIDSDTLLLDDISKAIPEDVSNEIYGSRGFLDEMYQEIIETNNIRKLFEGHLRTKLVDQHMHTILKRHPCIAKYLLGFNAGIVLFQKSWFIESSRRHGRFLMENFGDSIFADQGYMNLIVGADSINVIKLPAGVNVSPSDDRENYRTIWEGGKPKSVTICDEKAVILHFLSDSKPDLAGVNSGTFPEASPDWAKDAHEVFRYYLNLH